MQSHHSRHSCACDCRLCITWMGHSQTDPETSIGVSHSSTVHLSERRSMGPPLYRVAPVSLQADISVDAFPQQHFLVIINPSSGPGNESQLDPNYARELPKLNSKPNVRTIGYVRTGWATRNLTDLFDEVDIYASWAMNKTGNYSINGIFYDEAPNNSTNNAIVFMNRADQYVKSHTGFGGVNFVRSFVALAKADRAQSGNNSERRSPFLGRRLDRGLRIAICQLHLSNIECTAICGRSSLSEYQWLWTK